ncbi:MAG: phosphotransferase family protein [Micromonosporaceae bacterium]
MELLAAGRTADVYALDDHRVLRRYRTRHGVEPEAADLHRRLHALPARLSGDPAVRILHRDLHPENVIMTPDGPYLIDWTNAAEGDPAIDVAFSALILAEVAVGDFGVPPEQVRALLTAFLGYAGPVPPSALEQTVALRAADPHLSPAEVARLGAASALVSGIDAARTG